MNKLLHKIENIVLAKKGEITEHLITEMSLSYLMY